MHEIRQPTKAGAELARSETMAKAAVQTAVDNVSQPTSPEQTPIVSPTGEAANDLDIATVAYRLWEERGRPDGDPDRDWFEAERQLTRPSIA